MRRIFELINTFSFNMYSYLPGGSKTPAPSVTTILGGVLLG